jgi:hypothetical protein
MKRLPTKFLMAALLVAVAVAGAVGTLAAKQDAEPGKPTTARFYVLNKTAEEAVPVKPVAPIAVEFAPSAVAALERLMTPLWEYREITVDPQPEPRGSTLGQLLNLTGSQGWEVCGVVTAADGKQVVLMKRPIRR